MEQIRAFIAIELPGRLKLELEKIETRLKQVSQAPVKWVDPDSIHLTLKFLGSIAADRTEEITGVIEEAAAGISPFRLEVKGLGVFPNPNRVQVAWVGVSGDIEMLSQLQRRLESGLEKFGFPLEKRQFTPHLTLARMRDRATPDERQRFGRLIVETEFNAGIIAVEAVNLMKSQLTRQGAIYSKINSVSLQKSIVND